MPVLCGMTTGGTVPGRLGENEGLRFGESAAIALDVAGEELIAGRLGDGSADMLTTADTGEEALSG